MCLVEDTQNDPQAPHSPNVEPGRVESLGNSLKYWWFILLPLLAWAVSVEVRANASVTHDELATAIDALPPRDYRLYVESEFESVQRRFDHMETLINILLAEESSDKD